MMYEMRRRKPEPTLLPTQGTFNLPHHIGMVCEELVFGDAVHSGEMDCSTTNCYSSDWASYSLSPEAPTPRSNPLSYLPRHRPLLIRPSEMVYIYIYIYI